MQDDFSTSEIRPERAPDRRHRKTARFLSNHSRYVSSRLQKWLGEMQKAHPGWEQVHGDDDGGYATITFIGPVKENKPPIVHREVHI